MRTIGDVDTLALIIPDLYASLFDEELYIEILKPSSVDGSYEAITINGTSYNVLMWSGKGRYYFDSIRFDDLSKAYILVTFSKDSLNDFVYLLPKKMAGDIPSAPDSAFNFIPFWNGKNIFSVIAHTVQVAELQPDESYSFTEYEAGKCEFEPSENIGYFIWDGEVMILPLRGFRQPASDAILFEWIGDLGYWHSWYFRPGEVKVNPSNEMMSRFQNVSGVGNVRNVDIDMKSTTTTTTYYDCGGLYDWLSVLNTIKTSSFVRMYDAATDSWERVNVKGEEYSSKTRLDEISFQVVRKTKTAI